MVNIIDLEMLADHFMQATLNVCVVPFTLKIMS